jgi:hypothetical protein
MCKVLGLLLIIIGGFLLFEGVEHREASAAQTEGATGPGWINSLEAAPHANSHLLCLAGGGLLIVAGITLGTRCRPGAS